jgi:hypothetical protein
VGMKNLCFAGITLVNMVETPDKKLVVLKIRELDSALKAQGVRYDFQNLVK